MKEYFVELQQFITSSLKTQADTLPAEWRSDLRSGLDGERSELNSLRFEMNGVKGEIGRLDHRLDSVEHKLDAHHAATEMALQDILRRLPPAASMGLPKP